LNAGAGGGLAIVSSNALIKSSIFARNSVEGTASSPSLGRGGGGIFSYGCVPTIINCTIAYNSSNYDFMSEGGGIKGSAKVINSIIWGNTYLSSPSQISGSVTASYSNIDQDGFAGADENIRIEPSFVDIAADDFHLLSTSPCIDAGDNFVPNLPVFDFEVNQRNIDGNGDGNAIVDMGAYEFLNITPASTTTTTVSFDTDGDGVTDAFDKCPAISNPQQLDADVDGIGDVCDPTPGCGGCGVPLCEDQVGTYTDTDGDNWADQIDNCPNVYNPFRLDADGDGIGDVCDPTPGCGAGCGQVLCEGQVDTDRDSFPDNVDNCPTMCNRFQLDADGDGLGDVCDPTPNCGGSGQPVCEAVCTL
jgi:hypothetical protein